jgi:hypothetical protein
MMTALELIRQQIANCRANRWAIFTGDAATLEAALAQAEARGEKRERMRREVEEGEPAHG